MADYLKILEVARRLDVSEPTVRRMVKSGKLPSVFVGGAYRVNEQDLGRYLENAKVRPEGDSPKAQAPLPFEAAGGKRREEAIRGLSKSITGMASSAKARLDNIAGPGAVSGAVSRMADGEFRLIVGWLLGAHDMVAHMTNLLRETLPSEHEQDSADERELRFAYSLLLQELEKAVTDDLLERVESDIDGAEEAGMLHDIKERAGA